MIQKYFSILLFVGLSGACAPWILPTVAAQTSNKVDFPQVKFAKEQIQRASAKKGSLITLPAFSFFLNQQLG